MGQPILIFGTRSNPHGHTRVVQGVNATSQALGAWSRDVHMPLARPTGHGGEQLCQHLAAKRSDTCPGRPKVQRLAPPAHPEGLQQGCLLYQALMWDLYIQTEPTPDSQQDDRAGDERHCRAGTHRGAI